MKRLKKKDPKVWDAIQAHRVKVGMTEDQVRMAWGEPSGVYRTTNGSIQWAYGSENFLYFKNGRLWKIGG